MHTLIEVEASCQGGTVLPMIAPDAALSGMASVHLSADLAGRLAHGQTVVVAGGTASGKVRLYDAEGRFMGLGEAESGGQVRPRRLFASS
jgi:tRNA pseudouridine55 synthase